MFAIHGEKTAEILGYAQSFLPCPEQLAGEEHFPHAHTKPFVETGPYFCTGFPAQEVYTIEVRE